MVSAVNHEGNEFFTECATDRVVILGPTRIIPADQAGAARPPESEKPLKPFPYTSDWVTTARRRIMTEYWQQGFNDVQIGASTHYVPESGRIEVKFDIRKASARRSRESASTGTRRP